MWDFRGESFFNRWEIDRGCCTIHKNLAFTFLDLEVRRVETAPEEAQEDVDSRVGGLSGIPDPWDV